MPPDVSVIIPTYNRRAYLKQAIASCFAGNEALDVEVVVVDDGSTDGTRDDLRRRDDERIRPVFQAHQGGQVARNRGLKEARGTYVKFLDDDDWLAAGALRTEVERLQQTGGDLTYGGYQLVRDDGAVVKEVRAQEHSDYVAALLDGRVLTHLLRFTYRRSFIEGIEWSPCIPARQDLAFAFAVGCQFPTAVPVDRVVGYFRQHDGERVSTGAGAEDNPPLRHAEILVDAVERLEAEGQLTGERRTAAARGLWTWAYLLAVQDWAVFEEMYGMIQRIVPGFRPPRTNTLLSILDRWGSPRATERVLYPVRKAKRFLTVP